MDAGIIENYCYLGVFFHPKVGYELSTLGGMGVSSYIPLVLASVAVSLDREQKPNYMWPSVDAPASFLQYASIF